MDPSFTEISVDQIACHPMRLTELWVDQKLGTNIEQPRVPHLMKPHIQTIHIWSVRFGDTSSQQKFKWIRSYWNKALWSDVESYVTSFNQLECFILP